jgi:hypothetical protein
MELISGMSDNFVLEGYRIDSEFAIENPGSLPSGHIILYSRWSFAEVGLNSIPRVLLGRE